MEKVNYQKVFSIIDEKRDEYLKFWCELCDIESPTANKAAVDAACEYVIKKAQLRGWTVEIQKQEVSGDPVLITMNPEAPLAPIALSGHMDTVQPIGLFGTPPTKIVGDKIYGPGVSDCKGGIVAAFLAMDALCEFGYTERPVKLLIQTDEEVSSRFSNKGTINWICEKAKDCVAFLNSEPYEPDFAVLERKGILRYELKVIGNPAHSSACANGEGEVSAIAEAAYKIIELEKLKDKYGLTCNVGTVNGGTVANTVPAECSFVIDIRFANQEQLEYAEKYIKTVAETEYIKGSRCEVRHVSTRIAMEKTERNYELLSKMNGIFTDAGLLKLEARKTPSGSDAAYTTAFGIPTVDSLGVDGLESIHSKDENASIESLFVAAKRFAAVILGI